MIKTSLFIDARDVAEVGYVHLFRDGADLTGLERPPLRRGAGASGVEDVLGGWAHAFSLDYRDSVSDDPYEYARYQKNSLQIRILIPEL